MCAVPAHGRFVFHKNIFIITICILAFDVLSFSFLSHSLTLLACCFYLSVVVVLVGRALAP